LANNVDTTYLETFKPSQQGDDVALERDVALAAALYAHRQQGQARPTSEGDGGANAWRTTAWREQM
jgi:hypothetical protein